MKRRDLISGGILGGVLGGLGDEAAEAAQAPQMPQRQQQTTVIEDFSGVVDAINRLEREIARQDSFVDITPIREIQRNFLRTNSHMPNYIEVGAFHWFNLYDWHIRWQQPVNVTRDLVGRYTIAYLGTMIVLRPEMPDQFLSAPYDER
jgi:hypothetical protein